MSVGKAVIIALDGASAELIARWASQGQLPHLARLMERGTFGPLKSVIPPVTGAAWGSFLTGVTPGRHGVFEWLARRDGSYRLGPVDSKALGRRTLFEWLSAHGVRVGAVSVPLTYPIRPVDGFVVSGLLTPRGARYTDPPELAGEIERALGGPYPLAPPPWPGRQRADRWLAALKASLESRGRAALHLLARHRWNLFMVHFMETDSVQHQMWHLIDGEARPRYRVKCEGNPVLEVYRLADRWVGALLEHLDDETVVLVISDHGFGPLRYNLHLNTWLLRAGFLKLRKNAATLLKRLAFEAGVVPENLYPWEERLRLLGRVQGERAYRWLSRFALSTRNIDWANTVAYSYGNVGQIFLNRRGREPQGIVRASEAEGIMSELARALIEWRNPHDGSRLVSQVFRKEEAYTDSALDSVPDLVFLPQDGCSPMGLAEFLSHRAVSHPVAHSGWHRMEGVFVGAGGPLGRGRVEGLSLLDLFPTTCALFGVAIPSDLDGGVAEDLLGGRSANDEKARRPERAPGDGPAGPQTPLGPAEEEEIRERLRGLGYL